MTKRKNLEQRLAIKRTATGLGLVALRSILRGQRIIEYTGSIITNEEAHRSKSKYLMGLDEKRTIDGSPRTNIARYINHSCRPNAAAYATGGRIWIWSKKGIKACEEITIDYGEEYVNAFIRAKGCGCQRCISSRKREKTLKR